MNGLVDGKETERKKGTPISRWHAAAMRINPDDEHVIGDQLDELNGVAIYFNGGVNTTQGRNLSAGDRQNCSRSPRPPAYPP